MIFHIGRLQQWLEGKDIYPLYVEIGTSRACNHACRFCAFDYLERKPQLIERGVLKNFLQAAFRCGLRSVLYSGEGEPLFHSQITDIILETKDIGIDVALTTNGVLLSQNIIKQCLGALTWLRVSLNAATRESYAKIHETDPDDFNRVLDNLRQAVREKKRRHHACTIGAQLVLLPENQGEVILLAEILREIGLDYFIVKPFSQHQLSRSRTYRGLDYREQENLAEELSLYSKSDFDIIFRSKSMQKIKAKKPYARCLGTPFFAFITSDGNVYPCQAFVGQKQFCFGNINKGSFNQIFNGWKRKKVIKFISTKLDVTKCRQACRLDEINKYLWELRHPPAHVNFI